MLPALLNLMGSATTATGTQLQQGRAGTQSTTGLVPSDTTPTYTINNANFSVASTLSSLRTIPKCSQALIQYKQG
jgi:hypothetical protein